MYKFVIWDFDGTLFDTYPITIRTFKKELERIGKYEDYDVLMSYAKINLGELYKYADVSKEFVSSWREKAVKEEIENSKLFDGIYEILEKIKKNGGKNALYTHRDMSAKEMLDRNNITALFDDFIFSEDGFPAKPAPDAISALLERNCISKNDAIMIGDREIDVGSGYNAGIDSCLCFAVSYDNTVATYKARTAKELENAIFNKKS